MTREEAIKILKFEGGYFCDFKGCQEQQAFAMAIEALEQEPCEDAISRQAVDVLVDELARAISDERCFMSRGRSTASIMQDILDLPPVTPQPKTGKWSHDGSHWANRFICSECGYKLFEEQTKYCPNCGAKMVEPQESEVQDADSD